MVDSEGNVVGYASREDIYGDGSTPPQPSGMSEAEYVDALATGEIEEQPVPVRDENGKLVGHIEPDGGFVPLEP